MRDRLKENISIIKQHNEMGLPVKHITKGQKYEVEVIDEIVQDVSLIIEKMENETLIELPCKVGDTVYYPWIYDGQCGVAFNKVESIKIYISGLPLVIVEDWESDMPMPMPISFFNEDFGKIVFLTKAEAKQKLKEMRGN